MNINECNLINNYQDVNFTGAKSKVLRVYKKNVNSTRNSKTNDLPKKIISNAQIRFGYKSNFVFTYQKILKKCKKLNEIALIKKQAAMVKSLLLRLAQQAEINKKTCYFVEEQKKYAKAKQIELEKALEEQRKVEEEKGKEIYNKIISLCFSDIDKAILNKAPQEQIDKLVGTLDMFIERFGHYNKLS